MTDPLMLSCDVLVVLYSSADMSSILISSPLCTLADVPASVPLTMRDPVFMVPVTLAPFANHAMTIGLDL